MRMDEKSMHSGLARGNGLIGGQALEGKSSIEHKRNSTAGSVGADVVGVGLPGSSMVATTIMSSTDASGSLASSA